MLARRMDSGRVVLERANENTKCEKDVIVLDGFGEPMGVLERTRNQEDDEFASAETLMNSSLLVTASLKNVHDWRRRFGVLREFKRRPNRNR